MTAMRMFGDARQAAAAILTSAFVLLVGVSKPMPDWDIIGYVAAAYQQDGYAGRELVTRTFEDLRSDVDEGTFQLLSRGGETPAGRLYRETVSSDPVALAQQIPFYSIRVAYVGMVRGVGRVGLSYSKAARLIGAAGSALSVLVLAAVLRDARAPLFALPLIAVTSGVMEIGRYSTPDSLALLVALLAVLALLHDSPTTPVFAALLPFARTDFIVLSVLLLGYQFMRGRRISSSLGLAVALGAYLLINRLTGNYGWLTLINFSDLGPTPYPASLHPSTRIPDYLKVYAFGLYGFVSNPQFLVYALGAGVLCLRTRRDYPVLVGQSAASMGWLILKDRRVCGLFVIPVLYAASHILLFPHYEARYFTFSAVLAAVWIFSREPAAAAASAERRRPELAARA